jgi:hypothetical protein
MTLMPRFRPIHEIATEIKSLWLNIPAEAAIYLEGMMLFTTVDEYHGDTSARSVIIQFLSNARTWQGEKARLIKYELRWMAGLS